MNATKGQIITVKNGRKYLVLEVNENGTYECNKLNPELVKVSENKFRVHESSIKSVEDFPEEVSTSESDSEVDETE